MPKLSRLPSLLAGLIIFMPAAYASPAPGDKAPDFRLQDQNGEWQSLEQHRGKWIALYFYPKDDTPGCTKEACAFRDNIFAFDALNAVILGVSLDDVESHAEFAEKYSLPFSILADTDKQAANAYGVVTKIAFMEMASRQSFLISPEGNIVKHYPKVNPETHSDDVLADIRTLSDAGDKDG